MKTKFVVMVSMILVLPASFTPAQIATGGLYGLEKAVVANGGAESTAAGFSIEGTSGQAAAGEQMANGNYALVGGFWTPPQFAPTAAHVSVSGRVISGTRGLGGAVLTLSGGNMSAPRSAITSPFGYFRFSGVEAGHFYVLTVKHKTYGFVQDTQAFTLLDELSGIVFEAAGATLKLNKE
jgi:hypothetical protein